MNTKAFTLSIILTVVLLNISQVFAQKEQNRIMVGPNIQVSHDGNFSHTEIMMASNQLDPNNLLAGSILSPYPGPPNNMRVGAYVSKDGGNTWNDYSLPEQDRSGGCDPLAAFGIRGTAYFYNYDERLSFYRSENGGITWSVNRLISKESGGDFDHPVIGVDRSNGKYAGRIYITGMATAKNDYGGCLMMFRSDDDGRSFIGPTKIDLPTDTIKYWFHLPHNILISSKGTLFCIYVGGMAVTGNQEGCFIVSNDGGISFSSPKTAYRTHITGGVSKNTDLAAPQFAIDNQSDKYTDRIYCVFIDTLSGRDRIMFTYSTDEGDTWSKPKLVDANCPSDADQFTPAIVVNTKGIIGIRWFDTRGIKDGGRNEYFTASLDGGETFLLPTKISAEVSPVLNFSNELVKPLWTRSSNKELIHISFYPGSSYLFQIQQAKLGEHYTRFTADNNGVFHDFWNDSRDGNSYQLYTSAVKVVETEKDLEKERIEFGKKYRKEKKVIDNAGKNKVAKQITECFSLQFDAASYDTNTNILSLPVSLKNISDKPVYGPIKLTITQIDTSRGKYTVPGISNSDNKQPGTGAYFNYVSNNSTGLLPGAETEKRIWKFKVKVPKKIETLDEIMMKMYNTNKNYLIKWLSDTIADLQLKITAY